MATDMLLRGLRTYGRMLQNANPDPEVHEEVRRYVRHLVQVHGCCRRRG